MSGSLVYPTKTFKQNSLAYGKIWPLNTKKIHCGVDLNRKEIGLQVFAIKDGIVRHVKNIKEYDTVVCIEHTSDNGKNKYTSVYWHLEKVNLKEGAKVKKGQQIGVIGRNNGIVNYAEHLHFGIRYAPYDSVMSLKGALDKKEFPEKFRDPVKFLKENV